MIRSRLNSVLMGARPVVLRCRALELQEAGLNRLSLWNKVSGKSKINTLMTFLPDSSIIMRTRWPVKLTLPSALEEKNLIRKLLKNRALRRRNGAEILGRKTEPAREWSLSRLKSSHPKNLRKWTIRVRSTTLWCWKNTTRKRSHLGTCMTSEKPCFSLLKKTMMTSFQSIWTKNLEERRWKRPKVKVCASLSILCISALKKGFKTELPRKRLDLVAFTPQTWKLIRLEDLAKVCMNHRTGSHHKIWMGLVNTLNPVRLYLAASMTHPIACMVDQSIICTRVPDSSKLMPKMLMDVQVRLSSIRMARKSKLLVVLARRVSVSMKLRSV